jgi:ribosomal protein S18 acetylase RimI-like enzyme
MKIKVVELKSENAQEYLELRKMSEIELPQYVGPSAERELMSGNEGIAKIVASYESEGTILFGAFSEEKLVGAIAISRRLSPKFKHRAFIWGMYISNEYRQLKVGALLLAHVQSWAKNHQEVNVLWLQVTESNTPAVSFYKKHGFEIYGTEPQALFTQGEYHNVHYMQTSA